jgi:hypothetical protein
VVLPATEDEDEHDGGTLSLPKGRLCDWCQNLPTLKWFEHAPQTNASGLLLWDHKQANPKCLGCAILRDLWETLQLNEGTRHTSLTVYLLFTESGQKILGMDVIHSSVLVRVLVSGMPGTLFDYDLIYCVNTIRQVEPLELDISLIYSFSSARGR